MIPCVAYAAKSSPDEKDSTATQLDEVRAAVTAAGGRALAGEFHEANVSGFKGERGPQLAAAMAAAKRAAVEHGEAELWVWHTSRLARGDGTKGRRSLLKVYADLLYEGVQLRSVHDDEFARNSMLVGIASEQNNKYSRDLSTWVTAGKDRQMAAGRRLGGPAPDGLRRVVTVDGRGKPQTHYERDEDRVPVVLRAFELSESGMGDPSVARKLNAEGYRTEKGRTWTRRRVQDTLTNQTYAGRVVRYRGKPSEQVVPATNAPTLIDADRFDMIQSARASRDKSAAGRARAKGGRPTVRYALSKLAVCDRCGSPMYCTTSPYKRKDGSQARHYVCREVRDDTGVCDAPKVPAEAADAAIVPHLRGFFVDFEEWLSGVTATEMADRDALAAQVAETRAKLGNLMKAEAAAHERYAAALAGGDDARATGIEGALTRFAADRAQLEESLSEQGATLTEAHAADEPSDRLLDFFNELSAGVRGRLDGAQSVAEVNEGLRQVLASVQVETLPDGRVRLLPIFGDRDEWEPGEPGTPPLYPNTLPVLAAAGAKADPTVTGRNSHE